ncbi:hypothetical protein EDS67_19845 [candidate division KSB1 bacterium]|nr:MAG: hypothetical protein EDS67_19845 [candidate division KSB1 bacterium]MBC6950421.1 hypothetical protein [candidate division KSB1 bacterium]MCE7945053.1 hypothetical protein [Chlorobi bacterium CHB1]MDL1877571.1 hypothetical protein [Cytophagia bacterium CHB2]
MDQVILDEIRLKNVLKTALIEVLEERRALFSELFAEALEDIALLNAIKEGENTKAASKEEIYKIIEAKA